MMNEFCDAELHFPEKRFCFCELEKGHKGPHKALMFMWEDDTNGITQTDTATWARGKNLLMCVAERHLNDG
jgi:hypothetical protein